MLSSCQPRLEILRNSDANRAWYNPSWEVRRNSKSQGHGHLECRDNEANDDAMLRTERTRELPPLEQSGWLGNRICDANVQGLDVQEAHIRARSKSERAPMKTFMYVQNLELRACTPLVPGIFWPRKIQNFGAPGMNAGVRPKHERIRTNTFTYVQVLDVHGKY